MSALASLKRNWIWAGLLLLCMLIAATAFIAPSRIGRMELRNDAKVTAAHISDAVKKQPQTLIGAFAPPELAAHVSSIFHDLDYDHRMLRYENRMSGHPDGTLLVYLDQSERAKILSRYYGLVRHGQGAPAAAHDRAGAAPGPWPRGIRGRLSNRNVTS